tara:strand:+ start:61738 stop:63594 length:1857 start_codon:yes stop_codon:yes gene_type:complete
VKKLKKEPTKDWVKRKLWGSLLLCFFCLSCEFAEKNENIFILAVDGLDGSAFNCLLTESQSSLEKSICEEFVRFSHAHTTSPLSVPSMASILTGLYPYQHKLSDNGSSYLSEKNWTLAELAYDRNFHTAFFSGGGSIWRKSGFAQGFELFQEYDNYLDQKAYSPADSLVSSFLRWSGTYSQKSQFSVIHFTDLLFPNEPTFDDFGIERSKGRDSQIKEWKESVAKLMIALKKRQIWDQSYIVVVGLNGHTPFDRENEISALNLHSENTQVSMFIKPPRKKRDRGLTWTIDSNVALADIGASFFEHFGQELHSSNVVKSYSLLTAVEKNKVTWPEDRPILIESSWGKWKNISNTRSALLVGKRLYLFEDPIHYYNTLIDRKELVPISFNEKTPSIEKLYVYELLENIGLDLWSGVNFFEIRKWKLGSLLWSDKMDDYLFAELNFLTKRLSNPREVANWLAFFSLKQEEWAKLKILGETHSEENWRMLAKRKKIKLNKNFRVRDCFDVLLLADQIKEDSSGFPEDVCGSSLVQNLYLWKSSQGEQADYWREKFLSDYRFFLYRRDISIQNFISGMLMDVEGTNTLAPHAVEMYLSLPENKSLKNIVTRRIPNSIFSKQTY